MLLCVPLVSAVVKYHAKGARVVIVRGAVEVPALNILEVAEKK